MKCSHCGHDIPTGVGRCIYCGAVFRGAEQAKHTRDDLSDHEAERTADFKDAEEYLTQELMRMKEKRRNPVSKVVLLCIFFFSMIAGGLLVWLFQ